MMLAGLNQSPNGGHLTPIERIGEEEADDSQMVSQNMGIANTASISGANGPGGVNNNVRSPNLMSDETA